MILARGWRNGIIPQIYANPNHELLTTIRPKIALITMFSFAVKVDPEVAVSVPTPASVPVPVSVSVSTPAPVSVLVGSVE